MSLFAETGNLHRNSSFYQRGPPHEILAVAKPQVPVKTNLWVGHFMLSKSEGKQKENHA